jgi:FkbM family methyltransferase
MNFSAISRSTALGKLLRLPLRLFPPGAVVPVLQGPVRGMKWIVGSSVHGCWLGSYEYDKQIPISRLVRPGSVVYDIGAHVGFYTLLFSKLTGPQGLVIAYEPLARNLYYLKRHISMNRLSNVRVIEAAVSDESGVLSFQEGESSYQGRLSAAGVLRVRAERLDSLVAAGHIPAPDYMKLDIEGAEVAALRGACNVLQTARPTVFLATHGADVRAECLMILRNHQYSISPIGGAVDEFLAVPE